MPLKKTDYADDEIPIYDEAVIYKRGDYWQMRMWLGKEKKYARFSLRTRNRDRGHDLRQAVTDRAMRTRSAAEYFPRMQPLGF